MLYKLRIICSEVDDFIMEVTVDGNDTFLTLHQFLQNELGYDPSQMASFFTTDHAWQKETEITLMDMGDNENPNLVVMDKAAIEDYIETSKQRLLYVFDFFSERAFFIEVCDITDGKMDEPILELRQGIAPEQIELSKILDGDVFEDEFEAEEEMDEFFRNHDEFEDESDLEDLGLDIYREDY
jgi:hypothetical protein